MDKDRIDASLGLAFSLALFEQYQKSGLLQAELQRVPGFRGRCKGCLQLVEGKVVTCYLEDMQGRRHTASKELLTRLDSEKGPFEWTLTPLPPLPPSLPVTPPVKSPRPKSNSPIPGRIAILDLEKLEGWTYKQKTMLSLVFDAVDGRHTVEEIKANVPLPPAIVEEALRILVVLKVISLVP